MHHRYTVGIAFLIASLIPAAALAAGFAKQSLFLSQSTVVEGQTVFIYAVVTDDATAPFSGVLRFSDEAGVIGSTTVTMDPGKASTVSIAWTPKAGQHTITAALVARDGTVAESEDAVFVVDKTPAPPVADQLEPPGTTETQPEPRVGTTTVGSSAPIVTTIAKFAPGVAGNVAPVFTNIDSIRTNSVKRLDDGTEWSKDAISKAAAAPSGLLNTLWLIVSTFALYVCASLAYVVANIALFYPAIVVIFFLVLWKLYRMVRGY